MQEYVSVPLAARLAGVPQRTIRNWIAGGKLAARRGERGYIVRVQDVRDVAAVAGREAATGPAAGASAPAIAGDVAVSERDVQRAAAVIERAMMPLVKEIGDLREQLGRERARREAAERERDALRDAGRGRGVSWWKRWRGGS